MKPSSLYIHIPFCKKICSYCDFPKVLYAQDWAFSYVKEIIKDINSLDSKYQTIYIGGGTPTALDLSLLDKLLSSLETKLLEGGEFSIEANPETLNLEVIDLLKRHKVNRLSIGGQTSLDKYLNYLMRNHSFLTLKEAVRLAKERGFNNINVDMMYGFKGQSKKELLQDLEAFLSLDVNHLSIYSLQIEEGTILYNKKVQQDDDLAGEFYPIILSKLKEAGYHRYEVSNFAKNGYECKHNLTYWKDNEYEAIGLGASGYKDGVRFTYTKNLKAYLASRQKDYIEKVSLEDDIRYFFLTNLRLEEGFKLKTFEERFSFSFLERYKKEIDELTKNGLLTISDGVCKASDEGLILLDRILLKLY